MSTKTIPTPFYTAPPSAAAPWHGYYFGTESDAKAYQAAHGGNIVQTSPSHPGRNECKGIWRVAVPVHIA